MKLVQFVFVVSSLTVFFIIYVFVSFTLFLVLSLRATSISL